MPIYTNVYPHIYVYIENICTHAIYTCNHIPTPKSSRTQNNPVSVLLYLFDNPTTPINIGVPLEPYIYLLPIPIYITNI